MCMLRMSPLSALHEGRGGGLGRRMPAKVAAGVGRGRLPDRDYQQDGNQHAQCNFTHAALLRGFPVVSSAALARASAAGVRSLAPRGGRAALAELPRFMLQSPLAVLVLGIAGP